MTIPVACHGRFEREARARGFRLIAGVDEVGRGCLFGPVVAAAVVLSPTHPIHGLRDSKILPAERREVLDRRIRERAIAWAIGAADAFEIDRINILQASRLAMKRAVERLSAVCDFLLIDALRIDLPIEQRALIDGDARCRSIAAASIVAKVHRDACMCQWDAVYPQYGFARNKGYGTDEHLRALAESGPTAQHRFSFEPVRLASRYVLWNGYQAEQLSFEEAWHAAGV